MILIGYIVGYICETAHIEKYAFSQDDIILLFFPFLIFNVASRLNHEALLYGLQKMFILSVVGFILNVNLLLLFLHQLVGWRKDWSLHITFNMCIALSALRFEIPITLFDKTLGPVMAFQEMLQCEQLTYTFSALLLHLAAIHYFIEDALIEETVFLKLMLYQLGGLIFGVILGIVFQKMFEKSFGNMRTARLLNISLSTLSFYISYLIFGAGAVLTTTAVSICYGINQIKSIKGFEAKMFIFWNEIYYGITIFAFLLAGFLLGERVLLLNFSDFIIAFIIYLLMFMVRVVIYVILYGLSRCIGEPLEWETIVMATLSGYRGTGSLTIGFLICQQFPEDGYEVLAYITVLIFISNIVSACFLPGALLVAGIPNEGAYTRKVLTKIRCKRDETLYFLQKDSVTERVYWIFLERLTAIAEQFGWELGLKGEGGEQRGHPDEEVHLSVCQKCIEIAFIMHVSSMDREELTKRKHRILKRILNVQLASYWEQHDRRTLCNAGLGLYSSLIKYSYDKQDPLHYAYRLNTFWKFSRYILRVTSWLEYLSQLEKRKYLNNFDSPNKNKNLIHNLIWHKATTLVLNTLTLIDIILSIFIILHYSGPKDEELLEDEENDLIDIFANIFQCISIIFYLIFLTEVLLNIYLLTLFYYITNSINKLEILCCIIRTVEILIYFDLCIRTFDLVDILDVPEVIIHLKKGIIFRLVKLHYFLEVIPRFLIKCLNKDFDAFLLQVYRVSDACVEAQNKSFVWLENKRIVGLQHPIEKCRRLVLEQLDMINEKRPAIIITTETQDLVHLWVPLLIACLRERGQHTVLGNLVHFYKTSQQLVDMEKIKKSLSYMDNSQACLPVIVLKNLSWLLDDYVAASYLIKFTRYVNYEAGEIIINRGECPCGINILLFGKVRVHRTHSDTHPGINAQISIGGESKSGSDFSYSPLKFIEDPRNERGEAPRAVLRVYCELGTVTGRKHDLTVSGQSAVQVCLIPCFSILELINNSNISENVELKIWKIIGIRRALSILPDVPYFQGWLREVLLMYLSASFVPKLTGIQTLHLHNSIVDVILLEGTVMDKTSNVVYYAPYFIPKNSDQLILPNTRIWSDNTFHEIRLLFIPKMILFIIPKPAGVKRMDTGSPEAGFKIKAPLKKSKNVKIMNQKKELLNKQSYALQFLKRVCYERFIRPVRQSLRQKDIEHAEELKQREEGGWVEDLMERTDIVLESERPPVETAIKSDDFLLLLRVLRSGSKKQSIPASTQTSLRGKERKPQSMLHGITGKPTQPHSSTSGGSQA